MPSLQCLFCQHLNPPGVDYCNSCDGQLNLQPCEQCGAVDLRTATNCYKCGAEFSLPVAPGRDFPFMPAIVGEERAVPTPTHAGVADSGAKQLRTGLTDSHLERPPVDEILLPKTAATAADSRRRTPVAVLSIFLLLITTAAAVYLYRGHTARPVLTQGHKQAVMDVSGMGKTGESAPSNGAAGMDAALKPIDRVQTPARAHQPAKTPSLKPPGAEAALAAGPLPTADAEVRAPQDRSIAATCPPAVATLGLCNPDPQQEKP